MTEAIYSGLLFTYDTENNLLTSRQTQAFTYITYEMLREHLYSKKVLGFGPIS